LNFKRSIKAIGTLLVIASLFIGCADNEGGLSPATNKQVYLLDGTEFLTIPMYQDDNETFTDKIMKEINAGNESLSVLVKMKEGENESLVWASLDKGMSKITGSPIFKLAEVHPQWKIIKLGQGINQDLSKIYAFRLQNKGAEVTLRTRK
jgi:hypothetical protein